MRHAPETSAVLFETPDNKAPPGAHAGYVTTEDGVQLRYARWASGKSTSKDHPKGTILLLHGRSEFIEKFYEIVSDLLDLGYDVLTFDWRGQGASQRLLNERLKGHVEHFNQYLTDLETILSNVALPDCKPPFSIVAHSTGSLISLLAAPALSNRVERMVLLSPLLELNNIPLKQKTLRRVSGLLSFLGFGRNYILRPSVSPELRPYDGNKLTTDKGGFELTKKFLFKFPLLGLGGPTIGWVFAACRAMDKVKEPGFASEISIPTLIVIAGSDQVVKPSVSEAFARSMRSGGSIMVTGSEHELMHERDIYRDQLLAAISSFIPGDSG